MLMHVINTNCARTAYCVPSHRHVQPQFGSDEFAALDAPSWIPTGGAVGRLLGRTPALPPLLLIYGEQLREWTA